MKQLTQGWTTATPFCMVRQTKWSTTFSACRILLLGLLSTVLSFSTLLLLCMSSTGWQNGLEFGSRYCCWCTLVCNKHHRCTFVSSFFRRKKSKYEIHQLDHLHFPDSETETYNNPAFCVSANENENLWVYLNPKLKSSFEGVLREGKCVYFWMLSVYLTMWQYYSRPTFQLVFLRPL